MRGSAASKAILYVISITGMISNTLACMTVYNTKYLHSPFGVICALLAVSNFGVSAVFFLWSTLPIELIFGEAVYGATTGKIVGQISLFFLYGCEYSHVIISFNRLVTIACPLKGAQFFSRRVTAAIVAGILIISFIEITPYFFQIDCYFTYDYNSSLWNFANTECGDFCSLYFDFYSGIGILTVIFAMDSAAVAFFRRYKRLRKNSGKKKSLEKKLFFQSLFQVIPLFCAILTYHLIGDKQTSEWGLFLSFTVSWGCLHAVDGIVLVAFHARLPERIGKKFNQSVPVRTRMVSQLVAQRPNSLTLATSAPSNNN